MDESAVRTVVLGGRNPTSKKENVFEPENPSYGSMHVPGRATSISTSSGLTDPMLSIPVCDPDAIQAAAAQVTAGDSVSVQLRPSLFRYSLIVIKQTAHNFGVSTSVEISDLRPVSVPVAGVNLIQHISNHRNRLDCP